MIDINKIEAAAKAAEQYPFNTKRQSDHHWQTPPATVLEMVSMIRKRDAALEVAATGPIFQTGDAAVAYLHGCKKAADERDAALRQAMEALEVACGGRCNAEYNPCEYRVAIGRIEKVLT